MTLAFLFPGQGAQKVGMGRSLAEAHPLARETFATADQVLGMPLTRLCWEGPVEELKQSMNTQPALLTHSVAAWRLADNAGLSPEFVAGHSLGEYSACVAAGALPFEDALRLVRRRGELMSRAGIDRPGTMAAILGLDAATVEAVCAETGAAGVVVPANYNAAGQIVISGEVAAVEQACALARERGARRAIRLEVSGAFHSPLMEAAGAELATALDEAPFADARCPIVANVTAEPMTRAEDIRTALKRQLLGAVRWDRTMERLRAAGATCVELGTGTVLLGLLRTLDRAAPAWNIDDAGSLQATLAGLGVRAPAGTGGGC